MAGTDDSSAAVRPKSRVERPYSLSKDEAYARMLQEEEYTAAVDEDEEVARRIQQEINMEERRKMRESLMTNRPPRRAMTPITQLFSQLVHASIRDNGQQPLQREGTDDSDNEETHNSSDSDSSETDSTATGATAPKSSSDSSITSSRPANPPGRARARGGPARRGLRPTETAVSERTPVRVGGARGRGTAAVRGARGRGRGRGTAAVTPRSTQGQGSQAGTADNEENRGTTRAIPPRVMESSVPPLSLAVSGQELPEGETEPEIVILDGGGSDPDSGFIHIMRDPMLLLLFLMGRAPEMLIPDDIDPNDYESLWDLAEQMGEVKNRGMTDKELHSLPSRMYYNKTKLTGDEGPECRVCLHSYKAGEYISGLPCKHEFHEKCIKEWLKRNASCPICRHELKPS